MNIDMIRAASGRLQGHVRETPLLSSPALDALAKRRLLIKPECLQHTGSFKFRGGWSAVSALSDAQKNRGVLAYSSGNHAQGVAAAAKAHGVQATIVMPKDAPEVKIANTRALGANVILYDRAGGENREAIGAAIAADKGLTLIQPYDHPEVIAGQGTAGLEVASEAKALDIQRAEVLICAGGGGLSAGVATALEAEAKGLRVRTVEPIGFDDMARSLSAGQITAHDGKSQSICDAILTPQPGQLTFPILNRLAGDGIAVSEEEVMRAMALAFTWLKIVVEPGGAVALAAALFHQDELEEDKVVAFCTGGNVDPGFFASVLERFG